MSQQVLFKLNKRDGLTRRVSFPSPPSWQALAARIEALYTIPRDKLGVSYIDSDQEEVTLSSEEELQDFYHVSHKPGEVIKFFVRDLTSSRDNKPGLDPSGFRNTFGQESDNTFDAEWQQYPTIAGLGSIFISKAPESDHPRAFVEVVDSDLSADLKVAQKSNATNSETGSVTSSRLPTPQNPADKGKGRAMSITGISSTGSVLGENAPPKHPVHVYDVGSHSFDFHTVPAVILTQDTTAPIVAHSTPKPTPLSLTPIGSDSPKPVHAPPPAQVDDDPPLASIDPVASQHVPASLSNDVASLISNLTTIIASHPELAEGIRNIIRNASNGTYWAGQRQAVSQTANDVGQAIDEIRRGVEEEASRKIAAAIDGMLRSLNETIAPISGNTNQGESWVPPSQSSRPSSSSFWNGQPRFSPGWSGAGSRPPPRMLESWMRGRQFPRSGLASWQHPPPAPPPPPMAAHGNYNPGRPNEAPPPREPPPPPPPPRPWLQSDLISPYVRQPSQPMAESPRSKASPRELRAQVEAAKLLYKAEKERYRQEREARKNERGFSSAERQTHAALSPRPEATPQQTLPPTRPEILHAPPAPNIVSNARGQYPQLEMVSVAPRRHNTHFGHSSIPRVSNEPPVTDMASRTLNRITRRLADMGFTETNHPQLPSKIRVHMPPDETLTKDSEDDIVTTLLEELLASSSKPTGAGPSTSKDVSASWR